MKLLAQYPLVGLIAAAIGGILLIWWILRQPGEEWPKPQARDTFPPLFDPFEADDPALKVGIPVDVMKTPPRKRTARPRVDANGRLHDASGKFAKK